MNLNFIMTRTLAGLALVTGLMFQTGCKLTVSTTYSVGWYDVYGNYCGGSPHPGCNFYSDGAKIMDYEDPYYGPSNTVYYGGWSYYDSYGYPQTYIGWAWQSPTGIIYDEYGYALNEEGSDISRDLLGEAARQESETIEGAGKAFASKYALSDASGVRIARTLNDWATLTKRQGRARTEADIADFSKRLYGVTVEQTTVALNDAKRGDVSGLEAINEEIAHFWGADAKTSKKILKNWYRDQLSEYNVK